MGSMIVRDLDVPTLWMAHREELIEQGAGSLRDLGLHVGIIKSGVEPDSFAPVQVASIQTLARREIPRVGLIVIDECFPVGTMVGSVPIERLRVGDSVVGIDAGKSTVGTVTRTFKRPAPDRLIKITVDGSTLVCTDEHPILTPRGWTPAKSLRSGDYVYSLPHLRKSEATQTVRSLPGMLSKGNGRTESEGISAQDEAEKSDAIGAGSTKGQRHDEGDGTLPENSRREWQADSDSAATASDRTRMANGTCSDDRQWIQATSLQDRHCRAEFEDSRRSGRRIARDIGTQESGSEEGRLPALVRLDGVSVLQRGSDGEFERVCRDGFVYNVEVDPYHTYTANGIVVHNCHHAIGSTYQRIISALPGVPLIGLTATPFRMDGRGLGDTCGGHALFGEIVVSAYPDELVARGILHAPRVFAAPPPDLRGVKVTGGDFNLRELVDRMGRENPADLVKTWQARASGRRTVAFAVDIAHSQRIVAAFRAAGIAAEHLDGSSGKDERKAILARLKSGETKIVSNCMVLTEGWDLPALECALIDRPTMSLNLHLQMIGRIMRSCPGKDGAIVLDHAGNHHIHGLVTRRLNYSLDGSIKVGSSEPLGLKHCRQCFVLYENTLPACPECGFVPEPAVRGGGEDRKTEGEGELSEFAEDFDYRKRIWNLIEAERESMDFKPAWSLFRYEERFGGRPLVVEIEGRRELIDPKRATMSEKQAVYESLMKTVEEEGLNPGWASHRYREFFGVWPKGFVNRVAMSSRWTGMKGTP
jgi:DNA repair protein RadD